MEHVKLHNIVCAANKLESGEILVGIRHWDLQMHNQFRAYEKFNPNKVHKQCVQGFLDAYGTFLTREEAWDRAILTGQIMYKGHNLGKLFSEDLY